MSSLLSRSELKTSAVSMDKDKEKEKQKLFSRLRASRRRPWSVLPPSRRRRRRGRGRIGPRPSAVSSPPSPPFSPSAPPPLALGDPPEREEFRSLCIAAASSASEAATEA
jgi:hypothetical protein